MSAPDILNAMQKDLKLRSYLNEEEGHYQARIIYSAMSFWLKMITLDTSFDDQRATSTISKIHLTTRGTRILEEFLSIYPLAQAWYQPLNENNPPIQTLVTRLVECGQLLDIEKNYHIGLPVYREIPIGNQLQYTEGLKGHFNHGYSSGLSWLIYTPHVTLTSYDELPYFFKTSDAVEYTDTFYDELRWQETTCKNDRQYFDVTCPNNLSACWKNTHNLKDGDVTLGRHYIEQIQGYSYFAVKCMGDSIYTYPLAPYFKERFEVRRILYGLRAKANNPVKMKITRYSTDDLFEIRLYSKLPKKEESILLALGWPKTNIDDLNTLLFDKSLLAYIRYLFINLHIEIEEDTYE